MTSTNPNPEESTPRQSHTIHPDELKALEEATRSIRLRGGGDPKKLVAGVIPQEVCFQTEEEIFRRNAA